jgi:hypothetical protein
VKLLSVPAAAARSQQELQRFNQDIPNFSGWMRCIRDRAEIARLDKVSAAATVMLTGKKRIDHGRRVGPRRAALTRR